MVVQSMQDEEIILQLRDADINIPVDKLYKEYFGDIIKLIEANGGSSEDAADIFQETILIFVDLVKTGRFRGDSSIKTFLYAVSRNLWKQELRSKKRRDKRQKMYADDDMVISDAEVNERYFNKDMQFAINSLYQAVGEVCQNILKGFYYEELSMKELLKKFNFENEQVLRNKKSLCIKKIKDMFQKNQHMYNTFKNLMNYGR